MSNNNHYAAYEYSAAAIVAAPIVVSADTKNIFFVHLVAPYSHPTSYVIEVRLMVPDKKNLIS